MTSRNAKALGLSPHMRWHAFGLSPENASQSGREGLTGLEAVKAFVCV
jgi:hypothetical protein